MAGTLELLRHHRRVYAVDTAYQRTRIAARLRACEEHSGFAGFRTAEEFEKSQLRLGGAYLVNVLHTLESPSDRVKLLETTSRNLRANGFVVVDVPSSEHYYAERMTSDNARGDGYVFSRGGARYTFYRFCTAAEMDEWALQAGLKFDFRIPDNHHHVRIYRRAGSSTL